jgi:hypothetical protein
MSGKESVKSDKLLFTHSLEGTKVKELCGLCLGLTLI